MCLVFSLNYCIVNKVFSKVRLLLNTDG
jgi:uncharacterized membrane protein YagU involved in acid resistance